MRPQNSFHPGIVGLFFSLTLSTYPNLSAGEIKLYDRTSDIITLDEIEKIAI